MQHKVENNDSLICKRKWKRIISEYFCLNGTSLQEIIIISKKLTLITIVKKKKNIF